MLLLDSKNLQHSITLPLSMGNPYGRSKKEITSLPRD